MTQKIGAGLLSCADKIWETADTLRGAGIAAEFKEMVIQYIDQRYGAAGRTAAE